jgi:hypothetical protein
VEYWCEHNRRLFIRSIFGKVGDAYLRSLCIGFGIFLTYWLIILVTLSLELFTFTASLHIALWPDLEPAFYEFLWFVGFDRRWEEVGKVDR